MERSDQQEAWAMAGESGHKFDHVVSVMFENRTFDNLLGRLYQPGEVVSFEGVLGKELTNPIPDWPSTEQTARWCRTRSRRA
jgi:phospholipase C